MESLHKALLSPLEPDTNAIQHGRLASLYKVFERWVNQAECGQVGKSISLYTGKIPVQIPSGTFYIQCGKGLGSYAESVNPKRVYTNRPNKPRSSASLTKQGGSKCEEASALILLSRSMHTCLCTKFHVRTS